MTGKYSTWWRVVRHVYAVIAYGAVGFGVLLSGMESLGDTSSPGPVLAFNEEKLDVGTVKVSELSLFQETMEFTNRGDQPLILSQVRGCCGTRITQWPQEPIMPGETGQIDIQFRLSPRPHTVRRTVTVTSNAIEPTHVQLIVGQVIADEASPTVEPPSLGPKLMFTQSSLNMGILPVDQGSETSASVDLQNQGDQPLVLARVLGGEGIAISAWPEKPIMPGESATIAVQIRSLNEERSFSRNIFIFSNDAARRHTYRVVGQWEAH